MRLTRRRGSPARARYTAGAAASQTQVRIGAALLAVLCAWIALGQAGLLRAALASGGEAARQDLVSVALLGFFGIPAWIGLLALLRHARASFSPWLRGVLYPLAGLPPVLGVLGFVAERIA
jgi:hypothetical protein